MVSHTAINDAIAKNLTNIVKRYLNLLMIKDPTGLLYHHIIDEHLIHFLKMGINLKDYFNSRLPFVPIKSFRQYHKCMRTIIVPSTLSRM